MCQGLGHHGVHRLAVIVTAWSYKLELDEPTIILGGHMSCDNVQKVRAAANVRLQTRCNSKPQCIYYQHAVTAPIPWGKFGAWTTHGWSQDDDRKGV